MANSDWTTWRSRETRAAQAHPMFDLQIKLNDEKYKHAYELFEHLGNKQNIFKALYHAVKDAEAKFRMVVAEYASEKYTIGKKKFKEGVKLEVKPTVASPGALIRISGKNRPIYDFKVSPTMPRQKNPPKALKVTIKKGETKNTKYFVAQMPRGHIGVFERYKPKWELPPDESWTSAELAGYGRWRVRPRKNPKKQRIREKFTVSDADMASLNTVLEPALKATEETLQKRFDHHVKHFLGEWKDSYMPQQFGGQ